jgi:basic membrane protein A
MNNEQSRRTGLSSLVRPLSRRRFLYGTAGVGFLAGTELFAQAPAKPGLVALVHTQAAGDNGPVDGMLAALKRIGSEKNVETRAIYASDPATYEAIFNNLGNAGAAVVISTFFQVGKAMQSAAPKFPNTKWVQIFANAADPSIPNFRSVSFNYYLGVYLSGYFGGKFSQSGKIGYIGGISNPVLNADLNALKAGALAANPNVQFLSAFAGSFQDPAKGHEIATQMYGSGVDYIHADSAATDTGIIQAANQGPNRFVSGGSEQQFKLGPKTVVVVVKFDFGLSLYRNVLDVMSPDFKGGHHATGLNEDVIDFVPSPLFMKEGPEAAVARLKSILPEVDKLRTDIINGGLKIPFNPKL